MKIGFMGRTNMLVKTIDLISKNKDHEVSFIWTSKSEPFYNCEANVFEIIAKNNNCPYFYSPTTSSNFDLPDTDVVLSVNFVNILPNAFITQFPFGVLNAHSGALPKYKGNACPNWAIINDEKFVTLTVHKMDEELDSGPIFAQSSFKLKQDSYISEVYEWLTNTTPVLFELSLQKISKGIKPSPQKGRTLRTFPRKPSDSRLDFKKGVDWNYKIIRSSSDPFEGAFCYTEDNLKLIIKKAKPIKLTYDFYAVDGQILECCEKEEVFVVSSLNEALKVEDFLIEGLNKKESLTILSRSSRNRLN